jgi:hypothetical protein
MAGGAAGNRIGHHTRKQTTAIGTGAAMKHMGQMVLLMRGAPQRHTLARFTQVNRLLIRAVGHRAPPAVADPAEIAADIASHDADIRALVLIAHSVYTFVSLF